MAGELFELELFGGGVERRYRKMRPEVEAMPWGTLDVTGIPEEALILARRQWTGAAVQIEGVARIAGLDVADEGSGSQACR